MDKKLLPVGLFMVLFFSEKSFAQFDTTFYIKYHDMMGVGIFQSVRNNSITLEKLNVPGDTVPHSVYYKVNGRTITGFFVDYDKIFFALGFNLFKNNDPRKGTTENSNYVLQFGTNKLILEGGYRRYKGFYDDSTSNYISPFTDSTPYYQDPVMVHKNIKLKAFYFFNDEKFSYNSAYFGSFRQLKSAVSWMLGGNIYYNRLKSDTSLIPYYAREVFDNYGYLNEVRATGFSFGGGGSGNLVIAKRFFLNLTLTVELAPEWRRYHYFNNEETKPFYVSASSDVRTSFGFNSRKFYFLFTSINDFSFDTSKSLMMEGNFLNVTFSIGWRFHFENKSTKWLKENKIYKMI
jgi:hypothetical protein